MLGSLRALLPLALALAELATAELTLSELQEDHDGDAHSLSASGRRPGGGLPPAELEGKTTHVGRMQITVLVRRISLPTAGPLSTLSASSSSAPSRKRRGCAKPRPQPATRCRWPTRAAWPMGRSSTRPGRTGTASALSSVPFHCLSTIFTGFRCLSLPFTAF